MLLFGVALINYEVHEHAATQAIEIEFLVEVLLLGILLPLVAGLFLTKMKRVELFKIQAIQRIELEKELRQRLNLANNWEELSQAIVHFPREIAPFSSVSLLLCNRAKSQLTTAAEWRAPASNVPLYPEYLPLPAEATWEQVCYPNQISIEQFPDLSFSQHINGYSLPLQHGRITVGFLHLYQMIKLALSESEAKTLADLAPILSFAIESMRPDGTELIRASASETEQRRLARYLHDTVGQELGYLRLKLASIRSNNLIDNLIRQEIEEAESLTSQAFEHIRITLTTLQPKSFTDIEATLTDMAVLASRDQLNFRVLLTNEGNPLPLSPFVKQKIFAIFREAITNVQKHADASLLEIRVLWSDALLTISVVDDGKGVDLSILLRDEHFGIAIMKERAQEINGRLEIRPAPSVGTIVTLYLPIVAQTSEATLNRTTQN